MPDEPITDEQLYEQGQELYRRRQAIESRVDELPWPQKFNLIQILEAISCIPSNVTELLYDLLDLTLAEHELVDKLGPGWEVTDKGIAYRLIGQPERKPDADDN